MKKVYPIIISLFLGFGVGLAIILLANHGGGSKGDTSALDEILDMCMLFVAVALAAYLQIVLHEAGHLVCGLLSGYRFVSFRVGSITLFKDGDGKLRFKRFKLAGTGGQCLMSPPVDVPLDKIPTQLYNAGGVLVNLLCAIVSLLLLIFCDGMPSGLRYFLAATLAIGLVFALLNGIPLKFGGVANDGYNLFNLHRDKQAVKGFAVQLLVNEKLQNGTRLAHMPNELFDLGGDINYRDPLQANVGLMSFSRELDQGHLELAHEHFKELLHSHDDELIPLYKLEAKSELTYTSLATGDKELAQACVADKMMMTYITKHARVMSSKQRVLMAKALLLDGDRARAEQLYNEVIARHDSYLMQGEVETDIELMKRLLEGQNESQNQGISQN